MRFQRPKKQPPPLALGSENGEIKDRTEYKKEIERDEAIVEKSNYVTMSLCLLTGSSEFQVSPYDITIYLG